MAEISLGAMWFKADGWGKISQRLPVDKPGD